jgi:hypothetical protein
MSALSIDSDSTYASLAGLEFTIEGYALELRSLEPVPVFTRHNTAVRLSGGGQEGVGEDTTYAPDDQLTFEAGRCALALEGHWTIESFSAHLEGLDLFPTGPCLPEFVSFRRWAFESATLDLALRQASLSLGDVLRRTPAPVSFVVSPGPEHTIAPWARITWDAPIHSVADIERLPQRPCMLNIKPSRFGSVRALLDAYDYCTRHGIGCYGGEQFELGPGRTQIQLLASLFHPDAPNDVAPPHTTNPGWPTTCRRARCRRP